MDSFDLQREMAAIRKNLSKEVDIALRGPIGIISKPLRFTFYALALGIANLLIIQTISGAIGRARDDDEVRLD